MLRSFHFCVLMVVLSVVGCSTQSSTSGPSKEKGKEQVYDITGKVLWTKPDQKKVRLDHQPIAGWMDAMEMSFDVNDAKVLEGLKEGDQVHGKLTKLGDGTPLISQLQKH